MLQLQIDHQILLDIKLCKVYFEFFFIYDKNVLYNNTMRETIEITEIQAEGKKRMNSSEFIKGNKI